MILESENQFELIYSDGLAKPNDTPVSARAEFHQNIYPIPEFAPPELLKRFIPPSEVKVIDRAKTQERESEEKKNKSVDEEKLKYDLLENFYNHLNDVVVHNKSISNSNYVIGQLGRVLSYLKNWELLSEKAIKLACRTLVLVARTGAAFILADAVNIITLSELLTSSDVKLQIKLAVVSYETTKLNISSNP